MATELECAGRNEAKLLLQAFETFTHASNALETAYSQLQAHARRLSEELAAKNLELEKSLLEKQQAQKYLRTILERLPCGVVVLDNDGRVDLCNPVASEVLGQALANAGSRGDAPRLSARMRSLLAASAAADASKQEVEVAFVKNRKKRILATSGAPLTDGAGNRSGTLHIIRDITEVKALQEQNKKTERLSAMGEMAVELAHEIRNPLGSIELFASLLTDELDGDPKRWAQNISVGTRSLNTIVSNMLHFAKPMEADFSPLNLHDLVEEVVRFVEPVIQQRQVRLVLALDACRPVISGDRQLLKQMMLNLIFNAMKAMPSRGALTIRTRNIPARSGSPRSPRVELQVQDTGIGIPAENLKRIFDPYFTTNRNGTGLGLSVVRRIVQRHSGTIRASSRVNQGATFTVVFGGWTEE